MDAAFRRRHPSSCCGFSGGWLLPGSVLVLQQTQRQAGSGRNNYRYDYSFYIQLYTSKRQWAGKRLSLINGFLGVYRHHDFYFVYEAQKTRIEGWWLGLTQ